jgi:hypothetical protein
MGRIDLAAQAEACDAAADCEAGGTRIWESMVYPGKMIGLHAGALARSAA